MNKKEKLLKKYLDKKKKQLTRDDLFSQISALTDQKDRSDTIKLFKNKVKKRPKKTVADEFENKIFADDIKHKLSKNVSNDIGILENKNIDILSTTNINEVEDIKLDDITKYYNTSISNNIKNRIIEDDIKNRIIDNNNDRSIGINDKSIDINDKTTDINDKLIGIKNISTNIKNDSSNIKNGVIDNEVFTIIKCTTRTNDIQEARKKLHIFYEEADIIS